MNEAPVRSAAPAAATPAMPAPRRRGAARWLDAYVLMLCVLLVFPLLVVGLISLDTEPYIKFPPTGYHLGWYRGLGANPNFAASFFNSLIVATASTALALLIGVPAALLIAPQQGGARGEVTPERSNELGLRETVLGENQDLGPQLPPLPDLAHEIFANTKLRTRDSEL